MFQCTQERLTSQDFFIRHSSFLSKSQVFSVMAIVTMLGLATPLFGQQRPLQTADLELVPFGSVRAGLGLEFLQKQKYSLSGLEGDLSRLGVVALHVGAGERAEFEIR